MQNESHPRSAEPEGSTAPVDDPSVNHDQTDGPDADPEADTDTDADTSDRSGSGGPPDANLDSDARVDGR